MVPFFSSTRAKLITILVVLGVLLPLLMVAYLSYQNATTALLVQTQEKLGNLAQKTAR